jgi:hypothetical protein
MLFCRLRMAPSCAPVHPGQVFLTRAPTRATFDEKGKGTSNRFFVVYSLTVRDPADATIFDSNTDETFSHLVAVQDRFLELKIPLKSLGLNGKTSPAVTLEEANSLAKILPNQVVNFPH